jgi:hypothetical protein
MIPEDRDWGLGTLYWGRDISILNINIFCKILLLA